MPHPLCFSRVRVLNFGGSPVGFATVFHGEDHDGIAEIVKANAIVADAEAELGRLAVLEALDVAFAVGEITSHNMQDAECCGLIDRAKVGFGLIGPGDLLPPWLLALGVRVKRGAAHALEVFEGEA